jgi:D-amino-acid dehydrogenase
MLPGLGGEVATRWMGHRPAMPDSLPVLGRARRFANVIYAFGHGQLGLTMAAATGEVVADIAAGRDPGLDLAPYSAARFSRQVMK